ncbi:ABC transporter ATP-binding protein [Microbispora sp. H11081]|uniref:ABC transporter ATP-binding protein n=1 Tax=Microbispora sp. H11081 TaxID=2729107 RepID=UPI0014765B19|nr:oligopeptide/dipeptide ABC transporter ATP-binding protein [Microbispora sp. H11081]
MAAETAEAPGAPFVAGQDAVLRVENLSKHFRQRKRFGRPSPVVRAVDDVSFDLARGETLGLVGESGCGKTTLSRMILRLIEPTSGKVFLDGEDVTRLEGRHLRTFRQKVQVVFQDPYASLDPRQKVGASVGEPLTNSGLSRERKLEIVHETLERMGLQRGQARLFPHQFSGGQRQRIGIARALSVTPQVLLLDEPVSALDVSIQAQVLKLLRDLREEYGLSYILISHDLSVVRHVSDRVMVMYLGRIVEIASKHDLYTAPRHPYTASLLSAAPVPDPDVERVRERIQLAGDPPNPVNPPPGCAFHQRCFHASALAEKLPDDEVEVLADGRRVPGACARLQPALAPGAAGTRWSACHFPLENEETAAITA